MWNLLWRLRLFILKKERELRQKKAKQVHVEAYHLNRVWERIKAQKGRSIVWYIMTPANYGYIKNFIGTNLSKEELDEILSERARWLLQNGYQLELHIHFWLFKRMPADKKRELIRESINWGQKNDIEFTSLVPGWWSYDKDLAKICQEFNLNLVNKEISIHDYDL